MQVTRRQIIGGIAAGTLAPGAANAAGPSILFREIMLVDGTGAAPRLADVLVTGDRIAGILSPATRQTVANTRIVPGEGRVLAPGFIDTHTHGDPLEQSYESFLAMGVTTVLLGMDGSGPRMGSDLDLQTWLRAADRAPLDLNVATLASHGTLRRAVAIPDAVRKPDDAALARMAAQLDAELRAGAFGLSYGLEYVPGIYSETAELANLGRTVARHGGVVMSHMRSENDEDIERSIDELIASSLPGRPHVSHLKVVFGKGEARARALLDYLAAKRRAGIDLTADAYPYNAGYTGIAILFPQWALPPTDYAQVLATRRQELRDHLIARMTRRGGPEALLIGTAPYAGKTVAQASAQVGLHYADFLLKVGPQGGSGAHFTMDQALQDALLIDPFVALSTDGGPGMRHPRATGTYAKWIEDHVVKGARLPIQEAVRKATGLPAHILRLPDRGTIRVGAKADLILFDPAKVRARSSYVDPFARAEGFEMVMVNGQPAFGGGSRVGRPGRLLRATAGSRELRLGMPAIMLAAAIGSLALLRTPPETCALLLAAYRSSSPQNDPQYPVIVVPSKHGPTGDLGKFVPMYREHMALVAGEFEDLKANQKKGPQGSFIPRCGWKGSAPSANEHQGEATSFGHPILSSDGKLALVEVSVSKGIWASGMNCIMRLTAYGWSGRCIRAWSAR